MTPCYTQKQVPHVVSSNSGTDSVILTLNKENGNTHDLIGYIATILHKLPVIGQIDKQRLND